MIPTIKREEPTRCADNVAGVKIMALYAAYVRLASEPTTGISAVTTSLATYCFKYFGHATFSSQNSSCPAWCMLTSWCWSCQAVYLDTFSRYMYVHRWLCLTHIFHKAVWLPWLFQTVIQTEVVKLTLFYVRLSTWFLVLGIPSIMLCVVLVRMGPRYVFIGGHLELHTLWPCGMTWCSV